MKRSYNVTLRVEGEVEYTVGECNSPEEAEVIAEEMFADAREDCPELLELTIESTEAVPVEEI